MSVAAKGTQRGSSRTIAVLGFLLLICLAVMAGSFIYVAIQSRYNSTHAGIAAQQQLAQTKPDMILLDIEMPEMDGFEFLDWLRNESGALDIPVAVISSRGTQKYRHKADQLGANAFLGKPYLIDDLVTLFNQYLPLQEPIVLDAID